LSGRWGTAAAAGGGLRVRKATTTIVTKMTTKIAIATRARFCQAILVSFQLPASSFQLQSTENKLENRHGR
jgi:hypothetical protein